MISRDYVIIDQHGMHARPATALLKLSRQFKSDIRLMKESRIIQMKSLLNILSLALKYGDTVSVIIDGEDEAAVAEAIEYFFIEAMKNF